MNGTGTPGLISFPARSMASRHTTTASMHRYTRLFRRPLVPVVSVLILSMACSDRGNVTDPVSADAPSFAIADGARGFKTGFYWLPPMVENPLTSGTFDAELSPVVVICALDGDACDAALGLIETFTMDGSGSTGIRVDADHYIVNWRLDEYDLTASTHYRISVFAGPGVLLGYADVEPVSNGSGLKNVNTGEYIGLVDGRTLPIKFRIETGFIATASVTPQDASIAAGATQQFTATVTDLHGNTLPLSVGWTSENTSVAGIDGDGLATGVGPGSTTITATVDHVSGSATLTVEATGGAWSQISAGRYHTCGLAVDGRAFCWGLGASGQIGNGGTDDGLSPVAVAGNHTFASITTGGAHTCGLTADGEAFCWGSGARGQIGDGGTADQLVPVAVAGGHQFASISAGLVHTCGVTTTAEAFCWGGNGTGKLGNGGLASELLPVAVAGNHQFASISAGGQHTCGVTTAGDGFCWGDEFLGELGSGTGNLEPIPVAVLGNHQFASIDTGDLHTCGVTTDAAAFCWGEGSNGRLGNGGTTLHQEPIAVAGSHQFASVNGGGAHTCGMTTDQETLCWGSGGLGTLGDGGTVDQRTPVAVAGSHQFASISAGFFYTCGVTTGGEAYCWGLGSLGQLGNGGTSNQLVPTPVSDPF